MLQPATDTTKQPVDNTKGTASIHGMTVKDERAALIRQRGKAKESHLDPDGYPYDPWNEVIQVGDIPVSAAEFTFVFKKGQNLKTSANAKQTSAKKKLKRQQQRRSLEEQMLEQAKSGGGAAASRRRTAPTKTETLS